MQTLPPWPTMRAAVLAVVVAVHGVAALPLPHVVQERELRDPVAREEVQRWAERLTAMGYAIDEQGLGQRVVAVTGVIGRAHRRLLAPVRPVFRWTGTGQGWALFANPDTHPSRIQLEVLHGEERQLGYLRLDPEHRRFARLVESRRLRPVYDAQSNRKRPNAAYRRYAEWVWREIREVDPEATRVELTLFEMFTPRPGRPARAPRRRHTLAVP